MPGHSFTDPFSNPEHDAISQSLLYYFQKCSDFYYSLDSLDASVIILATLSVLYFYVVYLHTPDADPELLKMQAVPFPVRDLGHSQTFRPLHRPPGTQLMNGLPVRDGGPTKFRNGTMQDIWAQIPESFNFYRSVSIGKEEISVETFDSCTVKSWAIIIGNNILDILKTVDNTEEDACLVIIANNSIKTLVTIFAAVLFNIPVRIMQHDPNLKKSHLESMLHKANPFAVLVFDETLLEDIALEKLTPNLKLVLYTGAPSLKAIYTNIEVVNWDDFMINKDYNPKGTWLTTYPEQQVHKPLLGTIFMCKASGAPFDTPVPAVAAFTNNQIMSAIVAQKAFLPREAQLTKNDKLLLLTPVCNMYTIIHQLTALIECASLVFLEDQNVSFEETMNALKPTVLVCNDYTSLLLSSYSKNLGLLERARFAKSSSSIRRGTLRRRAVIPFLAPLRLIYTHQLIYPYLHNEFEKNKTKLDQQSCNDLRALAGAAVIHGLVSPMIAGPICQTTIADYRLLHGNMDVGQEHGGKSFARNSTLINFGPPMGSLEYNVSDYTGSHLAEKFNAGSLQVRGNSTCLESSSWVDTGINVMIGADGCVKLISR